MTELPPFFKSIIEQDRCAVVICGLNHEILYMNPAALKRYGKHGNLIGKSIFDCHSPASNDKIREVVAWFAKSRENNLVYTFHNEKQNKDVYMVALRDENGELIGYYEKHEFRNPEQMMKYDLK
ncbi:MAG TPA: fatty acid/phospholipid synthesis protein PlsX [Ruminococcaceae bacterium]|nr:fatty acid/phospholipid synthesis protein PlsX [Oscillospiraceae bacterium]